MYNKNLFRKVNDKKILHKIGKQWVVLSMSLLGALGLSSLFKAPVHANVNHQLPNHDNSVQNSVDEPVKAHLVEPTNHVGRTNDSKIQSNYDHQSVNTDVIQRQAARLHQRIMTNGAKSIGYHHNPVMNMNVNDQNSEPKVPTTSRVNPDTNRLAIKGQWGTAPYRFIPKTGTLETTGPGEITPLADLIPNRFRFSDIKAIQFAPGTQAPMDASSLFASSYKKVPTTDGHYGSDSMAYISTLNNLKRIDLSNLDTSNAQLMNSMFCNDSDLQQIIFGPHFNTSNVEDTSKMFQSDIRLQQLDLSAFDMSKVLDSFSMFQSDYALSSLKLGPKFNTQYDNYMYNMFKSDNSLRSLDLGNSFYTAYISDGFNSGNHGFSNMFAHDYQLASLNLGPNFNTKNATDFSDMFANASDLSQLNLGKHFYTGQASDMHNMFKDDGNLESLDLGDHFDTTNAKNESITKTYNGNPYGVPVTLHFHGDQGLFSGDRDLNTIQMNNARLTRSVDLSTPSLMSWYAANNHGQAQGNSVSLTDGQSHTGIYRLYSQDPIIETCLNFRDVNHNDRSIGQILVSGLQGTQIPFATVSNALGDGYISAIPNKDLMRTFPNTPYQYQPGVISVPVKKMGKVSVNGNQAPVVPKGSQVNRSVSSYYASLADQRIADHYQSSVSASVSTANQRQAKSAAQSADQRTEASISSRDVSSADAKIDNYYRTSVSNSVSTANQQRAKSAAQSTDQRIESLIANSAAKQADQRISRYYQTSVSNSVSNVNRQLADLAARSADQSIEASISNQAVSLADSKVASYYQNSVASSVSAANQQRAKSAAQSADRSIESSIVNSVVQQTDESIASSAATVADQRIARYYQNSVSASVSTSNQITAEKAASEADQQIQNSYQDSIKNSVASLNRLAARNAAWTADQRIASHYRSSVAVSVSNSNRLVAERAADEADQQIQESYQNSVKSSVASANQQRANSAAQSADQRIRDSYRNSVSSSVALANQVAASNAARVADQKLTSYYQSSVAASVSIANRQRTSEAAARTDQQAKTSYQSSVPASASAVSQVTNSSVSSNSGSEMTSSQFNNDLSALTSGIISKNLVTSSSNDFVNSSSSSMNLSLQADDVQSSYTEAQSSRMNEPRQRASEPTTVTKSRISLDRLPIGRSIYVGPRKISRNHVSYRRAVITQDCLAHDHITSVGRARDYSTALKRGTVIQIQKTFTVEVNHRQYRRYEIVLNHHHYFVTGNSLFNTSEYIRPIELRRHRARRFGLHRYYQAIVRKPCYTRRLSFNRTRRIKRVPRGTEIYVKKIINVGRQGHKVPKLVLSDGLIITANQKYIKLI